MKYLIINSVAGFGSTGKIAVDLCRELERAGHNCILAYGRQKENCDDIETYRIGTKANYCIHGLATRLCDAHGLGSIRATRKFLKWVDRYDPDVIWLHNVHGYYINIELLFGYLKNMGKKVVWTLHDCWSFTGHCAYFTYANCDKWKTGCHHCGQKNRYPKSILLDNSMGNYKRKRNAFCGVKDMTLITPSQWLADLVKQSFLKEYPVEVRYNTVDKSIFKPSPSDFREKYGLTDKKVILGVANIWDKRKGLGDFIKLAKMLDENFAIVLVGLTQKQIEHIPKWIIGIKRIESSSQFATVYAAADPYINFSKEERLGMKTVEAGECGTSEIYEKGSACEEAARATGGIVVEANVESVYKAITGRDFYDMGGDNLTIASLICIERIENSRKLAQIYSMADLFVNMTHEDNYPTVNLEAQACGTYVIAYDRGGCRETIL